MLEDTAKVIALAHEGVNQLIDIRHVKMIEQVARLCLQAEDHPEVIWPERDQIAQVVARILDEESVW